MQEPQRLNLCAVLQKSMKIAQKKSFLHRIIYIANFVPNPSLAAQDGRAFIILMDSNIKLINEDCFGDIITGFGLFYTGELFNDLRCFIISFAGVILISIGLIAGESANNDEDNFFQGPEETLLRHFGTLLETLDKDLSKTPEVTRMKVLFMSFHINKRYFSSWNGRQATPPVLLDKIEPSTSPEVFSRHIQNCIMKLYRMSEYLRGQPPNLLGVAMDNISELCRAYLPEVNLLDFLLDSPALLDVREFIRLLKTVPDFQLYHENIWPLPPDFVPYNILGEEVTKKLFPNFAKEEKEVEEEEVNE